jgi:predicted Co/Zn/Cd cation transporter (cation efflux family)
MMIGAGRELLQMSPNEELVEEVQQGVDAIDQAHNVTLNSVLKVGPELRIELLVKPQANKVMASDELHRMKAAENLLWFAIPLIECHLINKPPSNSICITEKWCK